MKKGQSLSMNTIIIAAIALVVLVVLVVLVLNAVNKTAEGTACESTGGICTAAMDEGTERADQLDACNRIVDATFVDISPASCGDVDEGRMKVCCVGVGGQ